MASKTKRQTRSSGCHCTTHNVTVAQVRKTMTADQIEDLLDHNRYCVRHLFIEGEEAIMLFDLQEAEPFAVWSFDDAHDFLHEVDGGSMAHTLCLPSGDSDGGIATFSGGQLCLFALALEANLVALIEKR
jgi:hypothetical protein